MKQRPTIEQDFMQMITGSIVTKMIHVAATLGIADELSAGSKDCEELAKNVGADPLSLYRLMRALAAFGIFEERQQGTFVMSPLAELLRSDVPNSMRSVALMYGSDWSWQSMGAMLYSVKTGKPALPRTLGKTVFEYFNENPDAAAAFDQAMTTFRRHESAGVLAAYDFSGIETIVDVGGGHGLLISAILNSYPAMRGILADLPSVVAGAKGLLSAEGVEGRCQRVATDFFEAVPGGGDAYMLSAVIHDWDDEHAVRILRNCRSQMNETGRLLLIERIIPPGNAPHAGKVLDIEMLVYTGGLERTEAQYSAMLNDSGFELTRIVPTDQAPSVIEGRPI